MVVLCLRILISKIIEILFILITKIQMLSRSSSFTSSTFSCTEIVNENLKLTTNVRHHESLQNLQQQQSQRQTRPMLSRPLNIENNNQMTAI